jgi:hypothetical protein
MISQTATAISSESGKRTALVREFCVTQADVLARGVAQASDWAPLERYVDVARFKRVGAHLEEFDWKTYTAFLADWGKAGTHFEFTEFRVSEIGDSVFLEIEERHTRAGELIRKNIIAVYRFGEDDLIVHMDIYEQSQGRTFVWRGAAADGGDS